MQKKIREITFHKKKREINFHKNFRKKMQFDETTHCLPQLPKHSFEIALFSIVEYCVTVNIRVKKQPVSDRVLLN